MSYNEDLSPGENMARALFYIGDRIGEVVGMLNYPVNDLNDKLCGAICEVANSLGAVAGAISDDHSFSVDRVAKSIQNVAEMIDLNAGK